MTEQENITTEKAEQILSQFQEKTREELVTVEMMDNWQAINAVTGQANNLQTAFVALLNQYRQAIEGLKAEIPKIKDEYSKQIESRDITIRQQQKQLTEFEVYKKRLFSTDDLVEIEDIIEEWKGGKAIEQ